MRGRPFLIAACQSILIMSPRARAAVAAVGCNKEGRKTPFEKSGIRSCDRRGGYQTVVCSLPAPVFVSIEEEEEEGKKTITRGKNGGRHHLIVVGRAE